MQLEPINDLKQDGFHFAVCRKQDIYYFVLNRVRVLSPQQLTFTQVFTFTPAWQKIHPSDYILQRAPPEFQPSLGGREHEGGREEGVKKWYVQGVDIRGIFFEKHMAKVILSSYFLHPWGRLLILDFALPILPSPWVTQGPTPHGASRWCYTILSSLTLFACRHPSSWLATSNSLIWEKQSEISTS